jgi:superfamily II helicase
MIATIITHNNRPALMIRKIIVNKEIVQSIVREVLEKNSFNFQGQVIILDKPRAIQMLKQAGLL